MVSRFTIKYPVAVVPEVGRTVTFNVGELNVTMQITNVVDKEERDEYYNFYTLEGYVEKVEDAGVLHS